MIYAITYGDEKYSVAKKLNAFFAKNIFKADKVIVYDHSSIDPTFMKENEFILSQKKGAGYWLWKPYIIYKTLIAMNSNDYLLYSDCASICLKNKKYLMRLLELRKQDILCFATPFLEKNWTNNSTFTKFKYIDSQIYTYQIEATFIFIKKSESSVELIKKWLIACCIPSNIMEDTNQIEHLCINHRFDQSLFSVICKMNNVIPYKSLSDRYLYTNIVKYYQKYFVDCDAKDAAQNYYKVFENDKYVFAFFSHHFADCHFVRLKIVKKYIKTLLFLIVDKVERKI